jgi:tRNA(Ile)-lysidine synthase
VSAREPTDPVATVLESVRSGGLLEPGRPVVVMYSGGRDSTCLLDVALTVCGADAVTALHVNHGLRPSAGDDERHCVDHAERVGVRIVVERAPGPPEGNVQAWARDLRYGAAERVAGPRDVDIAAGHTASDQAETVLYRLAASPGRRALLGMAPRTGRLIRPLLGVFRDDTAAYCRARGLPWIDDPANEDPAHARARIRHRAMAALRDVHPAAEANIVRTAELLRAEAAVLDAAVEDALRGGDGISLERLAGLHPALQRLVVIRMAEDAAGAPVFGVGDRVGELLALGARRATASVDLGRGVQARIAGGRLRITLAAP